MILLVGGTSETAPIATRLAAAGRRVLVSTATDEPLDVGRGSAIERRSGRLDEAAMAALVRERHIRAIVDATHPYAAVARATARRVARWLGVPYFTFVRPAGDQPDDASVCRAATHEEAAGRAMAPGRPVLLTTGAMNVAPYAAEARRTGVALVVRVLPRQESRAACRRAGIPEERIIAAKGPFTVEENRRHIREHGIGVLVTKDSGEAGGVPAKLAAARLEGCQVVIVERPAAPAADAYASVDDLIAAVLRP